MGVSEVRENLARLKESLPPEVTLVAVSKTKTAELVQQAYDAGHRDFGENYVQELGGKQSSLPLDIRWHFIGHLQSNKVRYIAPFVQLIHGIDSLKLLGEINKQALKNSRVIDCLLQLHIAIEETKFGLSFAECSQLLESAELSQLKNIRIRGFMAMASNTGNEDQVRKEFRSVKDFQNSLSGKFPELTILSYGMSGDYRIAVEEGSNMIRIGSLIFGER